MKSPSTDVFYQVSATASLISGSRHVAGVAWNHPSGGISGHTFDDLVEFAWNRRKEYVYIYIYNHFKPVNNERSYHSQVVQKFNHQEYGHLQWICSWTSVMRVLSCAGSRNMCTKSHDSQSLFRNFQVALLGEPSLLAAWLYTRC